MRHGVRAEYPTPRGRGAASPLQANAATEEMFGKSAGAESTLEGRKDGLAVTGSHIGLRRTMMAVPVVRADLVFIDRAYTRGGSVRINCILRDIS